MAFEAQLVQGNPLAINHKPTGGNIAAGAVVVIKNTVMVGIAREPIVNNVLGALDVLGGVYLVKVADANTTKGAKVWWDDAANACTTTSTNNTPFGFIVDDLATGTGPVANTFLNVMNQAF